MEPDIQEMTDGGGGRRRISPVAEPFAPHVRCSFCSKGRREVRKLISTRSDVHICNECTDVCYQICHPEARIDFDKRIINDE